MPLRDPDEQLTAVFKLMAYPNPARSLEAGRPIFDDREICEIRAPGNKDIKHFPALAFSHWAVDPWTQEQRQVCYAERFSQQYKQFKAQELQTKTGTPLQEVPFLTEARRAELRALSIYTIEQLAGVDGQELKNLGPGGRDLKNKAIDYIEDGRRSAPDKQLTARIEALEARNAALEVDNKLLLRRVVDRADFDFEDMTEEQLREYIVAQSGQAPAGSLPRKTLKRMAQELAPEKTA